ncbi:MAG: hypothetical protein ABSF08_12215 [Candidatus Cybelea sp.]|jgi:hypothetical protein
MQRLTQATTHLGNNLAHGAASYFGLNVVLLIAEARWHLVWRLMLWDVSEMKTFGFLLGKTLHP